MDVKDIKVGEYYEDTRDGEICKVLSLCNVSDGVWVKVIRRGHLTTDSDLESTAFRDSLQLRSATDYMFKKNIKEVLK